MRKLMNNSAIKLIVCVGLFCGTNFGMEKEGCKQQKRRLQQHRVKNHKEDDACNERCLESCENCCLSAVLPVTTAVVLTAIRVIIG